MRSDNQVFRRALIPSTSVHRHVAAAAVGIGPGDEVLTSGLKAIAS